MDFWINHYLFRLAENLGYIDDLIFPAFLRDHFGMTAEKAIAIYRKWKKAYLESLIEREEKNR